jgi:four helix bundle protein
MALAAEDLVVLRTAESISDSVWKLVVSWEGFARDAVGRQLVTAADSVGANLAQAFNCRQEAEKLPFLYAARGRLFETKYWLNRAQARGLLQPAHVESYVFALSQLARQLNGLAAVPAKQAADRLRAGQTMRETVADYWADGETAVLFSEADFEFLQTFLENEPPMNTDEHRL